MNATEIITYIIGICLLCYFVMALIWKSDIKKTAPQITFSAFKKLYVLSPSKWNFDYEEVQYKGDNGWTYIEFKHYIDVIRYGFFKRKIKKNNDYLKRIQNEKEFLASVQNDINSYRQENLSEIKRLVELESK